MRPIEFRADMDYRQALRCLEFRIPKVGELKSEGYALALGLRYGLIGAAATHHLLLSSNTEEERYVFESALGWPQVVADHVRHEIAHRLPYDAEGDYPELIGRLAQRPIETTVPLYRRMSPLDACLRTACEEYTQENLPEIRAGWPWLKWRRAMEEFRGHSEESIRYATCFFERRLHDLEEVREIALLGE